MVKPHLRGFYVVARHRRGADDFGHLHLIDDEGFAAEGDFGGGEVELPHEAEAYILKVEGFVWTRL